MKNKYGFGKKVTYTFDKAIEKVIQELAKEGFGILTEIDVAATLKKKLNLDIPSYRILGACNPTLAHRALEIDQSVGLLLPCNVVVRSDAQKNTYVEFQDPNVMVTLVEKSKMKELAKEAREHLDRVMDAL